MNHAISRALLAFAISLALCSIAFAQSTKSTALARPTIEGTWRVTGIDQRRLDRPINNFQAIHFNTTYLPIGTMISITTHGGWGTDRPDLESAGIKVHAPIPEEVCGPVMPKGYRNFLCDGDGKPDAEDYETASGQLELAILGRKSGNSAIEDPEDLEHRYLSSLGIEEGHPVFFFQGGAINGIYLVPYGPDTLLIPDFYTEDPYKDVSDPANNAHVVLLVLKRVK